MVWSGSWNRDFFVRSTSPSQSDDCLSGFSRPTFVSGIEESVIYQDATTKMVVEKSLKTTYPK
jgi:hypothetical protein